MIVKNVEIVKKKCMVKVAGNLKSYMDSKCRGVSKVAFGYNTGKTHEFKQR